MNESGTSASVDEFSHCRDTTNNNPQAGAADLEKAEIIQDPENTIVKETDSPEREDGTEIGDNVENDSEDAYPHGFRLLIVTLGLMAFVLMVALDNYILATAIPKISSDFNSLSAVGWYASSYFLTQMAFQPAFGHLFDDFSVKVMYLIAMVIFEIGSVVCASARSSATLIVGRLIAGAGDAGAYVGTLTLMGYAVPIRKRPLYLSVVTSMFGVASVAGPLLGGLFTDSKRLTWRFCFWVNLPIGFVGFVLVAFFFKAPARPKRENSSVRKHMMKLDSLGICFLISAFVCLSLALQWAVVTYPWSDPKVWGCILGFALLLSAFFADQLYKKEEASILLKLMSQRTVAASSSFLLFIQTIVGALIYYLPFYFQAVQGVSAQESGIRNLPFLITLLFAPMLSGGLISIVGYYVPFMWLGAALAAIGSGLLFTIKLDTKSGTLAGYQFLVGFGLGICNQIPYNAAQYMLPKHQMVMGSTLVSFCNSLGPVLGTNIAQALFVSAFAKRLEAEPGVDAPAVIRAGATNVAASVRPELLPVVREAYNYALTRVFVLAVVCGVAAFCCSLGMEWGNVKKPRERRE